MEKISPYDMINAMMLWKLKFPATFLRDEKILAMLNVVRNRVGRGCGAVGRATSGVRDCRTHATNKVDRGGGFSEGRARRV
eukprot:IDg7019t1